MLQLHVYDITGDVIILNKDDSSYLGSKSTNGSDTWNIDFKGELKEGLLYVSYNWNKQADVSDWHSLLSIIKSLHQLPITVTSLI